MFDPTSRYYSIETVALDDAEKNGATRSIAYKKRRLIPRAEEAQTILEHTVAQGDRLDTIAARYLGDPALFWRLCDANGVLRPEELEEVGKSIKITLPGI
jgi:hypothetical protein